jgi:hypothetical protein
LAVAKIRQQVDIIVWRPRLELRPDNKYRSLAFEKSVVVVDHQQQQGSESSFSRKMMAW